MRRQNLLYYRHATLTVIFLLGLLKHIGHSAPDPQILIPYSADALAAFRLHRVCQKILLVLLAMFTHMLYNVGK